MNSHQVVSESFMGPILLSASENGLCRVSFMNQKSRLEKPIYSKKNNPFLSLAKSFRVIASSGKLQGYASGLAHKESLLQLEGLKVEKGYVG
jgi:hypothetical protein